MGHETSGARKWVPARALARLAGTTELVVRMFVSMHALTYSIVKQPIAMSEIAWSQKKIGPCLSALGQRIALISVSSLPLRRGGRRADKAHCPDYSGRCPDYSGRWA